jgi:2-hydroxy-3-keto-5-methylthiopentenyl-1-phosphate phosphatase
VRLVVVMDFDGTVTEKDVGDEVCERFALPEWRDIDAAWVRNEISLRDAQRRMWQLLRCERDEAVTFAREVAGRLRPGLQAFLDGVAERDGALWLASGGFDFYIEAILGEQMRKFERLFYNRARFIDGGVQVDFPHAELHCSVCGVCKGKVCDLARAEGARVVFVGDGASDRCALGRADRLCAVHGSLLARTCDEKEVNYVGFDRLDEVLAIL